MTERAKPSIKKNDASIKQVCFRTTIGLHKRFLDKIIAEGYSLDEALSFLMQQYLDE